jgi:hypothetical protein
LTSTAALKDAGVILDERGRAWPPHPLPLAKRVGRLTPDFDVVAYAVRQRGYVHVMPLRDALVVRFHPATVHRLAAIAAFYEIAARMPKRLVLACLGSPEGPDRYEIFFKLSDGLRRLEAAADARQARDSSKRLCLPLEAISPEDDWFALLFRIWREARAGRRLPASEAVDTALNIACGRAHIVDTREPDPRRYRFRLWGSVNSYGYGQCNLTLGEMPAGLMRSDAIEDYRNAVNTGVPTYQLINRLEDNVPFSYARLLLPLACDGWRVDGLLILINERRIGELSPL